MTARVDVERACGDVTAVDDSGIERWVQNTLAEAQAPLQGDVAVRVVDRDEIHRLNRDFRQRDSATNVLSFPAGTIEGLPNTVRRPLGDIVICASVVADEARQQGKQEVDHWAHMLVHGTLHLLGFDHENDAQAAEMEAVETRILGRWDVPDPYKESPSET